MLRSQAIAETPRGNAQYIEISADSTVTENRVDLVAGIAENLLANLVFWLGIGAFAYAIALMIERRLLSLFGLERGGVVDIHLSNAAQNLPITSDGRRRRTLSLHESWAGASLASLFGSAPLRLPDVVRGLVDAIWLRDRIRARISVSSFLPQASGDCLIVVGASSRNESRRRLIGEGVPRARLSIEEGARDGRQVSIIVTSGGSSIVIETDSVPAIVEKQILSNGSTVLFCLGESADATWIAAEYFVRNWKMFSKKHGKGPFLYCLAVPRASPQLTEYVEPRVIA